MLKSFAGHARLTSLVFVFLISLVVSPEILLALSSNTQPLSSNIFVQIAKKQNPAVVNVSIKGKSEVPPQRNFPAPRRGPRGGPRGGPGQDKSPDAFRDFYDRFFNERPIATKELLVVI